MLKMALSKCGFKSWKVSGEYRKLQEKSVSRPSLVCGLCCSDVVRASQISPHKIHCKPPYLPPGRHHLIRKQVYMMNLI